MMYMFISQEDVDGAASYKRRSTIHVHRSPAEEPMCLCGARLDEDNHTLCRKCSARSRWQRRRANARRHVRPGRSTPSDPAL